MYMLNRKLNVYPVQRIGCYLLEKATNLSALNGCRVLVLLDEQNLSIGAGSHGFKLDYGLLAMQIRHVAKKAELHIFIALNPCDNYSEKQFAKLGFRVHVKTIRYLPQRDYQRRPDSNIDNLFAFWAGVYSAKTNWDVIICGSGDYGLSGELSSAIANQRRKRQIQIMTLSLPGSTSQELNATNNPAISANLEIGLDVLKQRGLFYKNGDYRNVI